MATIWADNAHGDRYMTFPGPSGFLALEAWLVGGMVGWRHGRLEAQMTERTSDGLDLRRRKLLFRCWHRGMREMDLIMGRFADVALAELSDQELADLERLIELPDRDLLAWVTGEVDVPADVDTVLFRRMRDFHKHREG
jgi:antitoxin CptB